MDQDLATCVEGEDRGHLLDVALEGVVAMDEPDERASAFARLVPLLSVDGLVLARNILSAIEDDADVVVACCALADGTSGELLDQLLARAEALGDEYVRAQALALLAPHLRGDRAGDALRIVDTITDPTSLAEVALPALARQASGSDREELLRRAIGEVLAMDDPERAAWAFEAFRDLLEPDEVHDVLGRFEDRHGSDTDEWRTFRLLRFRTACLPRLPADRRRDVVDSIVADSADLTDPSLRCDVLHLSAAWFDDDAWQRMCDLVRAEPDLYERGIVAGFLMETAPAPRRTELAAAALERIVHIEGTEHHSAQERVEGASARVMAYSRDPEFALGMVERFESSGWRRAALIEFARAARPELFERVLADALALDRAEDRASVLLALVPSAPPSRHQGILALAFDAVVANRSDLLHDPLLPELASALARVSDDAVRDLWVAHAADLARLTRPELLRKLHGLAGVVGRLGPDACDAAARAVLDAERWWP